jgi:hypothetical protein
VEGEGGAARLEDPAGLGDAAGAVEPARPQPLGEGGEVPGVDEVAVGGGLAADGVEAGAVQQRRQQRVAGAGLVEPRDGSGGAGRAASRPGSPAAGGGGARGVVARSRHRMPRQRLARAAYPKGQKR